MNKLPLVDAELSALAPLGSAFITGLVALMAVWLTSRANKSQLETQVNLERERQRAELLRERGEELYMIVENWTINVFNVHFPIYKVMKGEISYNEYLDLHNQTEPLKDANPRRFKLLVDVYFPDVRDTYDAAQEALRVHNEILRQHKAAYLNGDNGSQFIEPFKRAQINFEKRGEELKEVIAEQIRSI